MTVPKGQNPTARGKASRHPWDRLLTDTQDHPPGPFPEKRKRPLDDQISIRDRIPHPTAGSDETEMGYQCATCGQQHDGLPDLGWDRPHIFWLIPEEERAGRIELTSDTCILDHEHYFIRGVIEIPIVDATDTFGLGAWVTQKRENFHTYLDHPDSAAIGPFFGWLSTHIAYYPEETLSLKTRARFRAGHQRPAIELEPTGHPLTVDQHNGITLEKAWEIVHFLLGDEGCV